jgi:hypothetical protein
MNLERRVSKLESESAEYGSDWPQCLSDDELLELALAGPDWLTGLSDEQLIEIAKDGSKAATILKGAVK